MVPLREQKSARWGQGGGIESWPLIWWWWWLIFDDMEESGWRFVVEVVVDSREAGFEGHGEGDQRL